MDLGAVRVIDVEDGVQHSVNGLKQKKINEDKCESPNFPILVGPVKPCLRGSLCAGEVMSYLSLRGWLDVGVAGVADDVVHLPHGAVVDIGERGLTVVRKVAVHLPRLPEVRRALDHHGSRSEGLAEGLETSASVRVKDL